MKILKYILFAVLGLIVLFLSLGLIYPSVSYGHEIKVDKSIEEAWAVSQDETKYGEWLEGFKSMELISGEKYQTGSKYKVVVAPGNGQPDFEMTETLVSIKEFDHVTMHFDSEAMDFEQTIFFSETDDGATVKSDSKVIGKNLMSRSMFAAMELLMGAFQSQEEKNFEAF